jgi:endonuclease/exonuclease/phosphatase family metal-dependent hydrolase
MKKYFINLCLVLSCTLIQAQETINVMFYNLLEFPISSPGGRDVTLKNILNEFDPDIFMVCELQNETGADMILNTSLNDEGNNFERADFVLNQSSTSNLQQLIFYRSSKFTLESQSVLTTPVRDINKYVLKLNTTDQQSDPVFLYAYVTHLKSSQGTDNQNLRLAMVNEFTNDLANIPPNSYVLFAGDFNLYTSSEPAYQEILDPTNAIVMKDPIDTPGDWHNEPFFQAIHTQSTRIVPGSAGAGGGLDDRFDFITISETLETSNTLHYKPDTYVAFGNNGNCYNNDISSPDCIGDFSQTLRNSLYSMSDHLPVAMQLETDKEFVLNNPEFVLAPQILLAQNPVSEKLNIKSNKVGFKYVKVFNTLGQLVKEISFANNPTEAVVDVSFLSPGVYYIFTNFYNQKPIKFIKK